MQNMWISVALIVAVIIVGIIAGKRLSTPGPQRRAVYFAFGTLAVLALWFFIFVAFFPAEWIVPFFTVACIIIPICVYMMVLRSGGKERAKVPYQMKRRALSASLLFHPPNKRNHDGLPDFAR